MLSSFVFHIAFFLLVSFVVALSTSAIKLRSARAILGETVRFFWTVTVCIGIFGLVVALLDMLVLARVR